MSYNDLEPGQYEADLVGYGVEENKTLKKDELILVFTFMHLGSKRSMTFKSFLEKKDGNVNQKTVNTLVTCGYQYSEIAMITEPNALNKSKKYVIDIIKDNNGYWKIEWVNVPGGSAMANFADKKALSGVKFSKFNGALMKAGLGQKKVVKNYAPGASNPPADDEINEEMGF